MSTEKFYFIENALPKDFSQIVYRYAIFDEMKNPSRKDVQVPSAYSKYGDSLMESLLIYLQPQIENVTKLKLFPTYAYYRIYRNGDILKPHKDRPSCEISASICLGTNYSTQEYSWPLFIDGNPINLNVGDMAVYKGLESCHWRNKFDGPENSIQVQAFLHYVNADGEYSNYKYDGRPGIGFSLSTKTT